ncbi:MAG: hypothetical protein CSB13_04485 [Chloroflexi bacterium]|nr:MAG: hypothetical protein CSB13_04485 [Chloroflexota bacterium]
MATRIAGATLPNEKVSENAMLSSSKVIGNISIKKNREKAGKLDKEVNPLTVNINQARPNDTNNPTHVHKANPIICPKTNIGDCREVVHNQSPILCLLRIPAGATNIAISANW